ncbi:hypothetical protein UFOVP760_254 [uncultured Caudovirales phage]|uniref:Uncharacterized protein n=1 Tax=uncultured Caudovirales phage TaxID=2100421 RepID=A0A6J7X658_9CAUD|nr:hypothetical protein UFOVP760_254 [uncultured Caudovirales phage]
MKNKNNKSANELLNLIVDYKRKKGEGDAAYAYGSGVLIAIMDWSRGSANKNELQNEINSQYEDYEKELMALKLKDIQSVANKASMEELMA